MREAVRHHWGGYQIGGKESETPRRAKSISPEKKRKLAAKGEERGKTINRGQRAHQCLSNPCEGRVLVDSACTKGEKG